MSITHTHTHTKHTHARTHAHTHTKDFLYAMLAEYVADNLCAGVFKKKNLGGAA
jgi:hypothetical protein